MPSRTSWSRSRVIASSAPNGSSISSTSASWARARARATRCRIPPDSSCGRLPANAPSWTRSSSSATRCWRSALGTPLARIGISTFFAAVSQGNSADSWNMSATRRSPVDSSPEVGASSPATSDSRVLLPHPDAPIRQTNSPGATDSDTRSRATSAVSPRPKVLDTSSIRMAVPALVSSSPGSVVMGAPLAAWEWADAPGITPGGVAPRESMLMGSPVLLRWLSERR